MLSSSSIFFFKSEDKTTEINKYTYRIFLSLNYDAYPYLSVLSLTLSLTGRTQRKQSRLQFNSSPASSSVALAIGIQIRRTDAIEPTPVKSAARAGPAFQPIVSRRRKAPLRTPERYFRLFGFGSIYSKRVELAVV